MKLLHIPILNSHPCLFIERKESFPSKNSIVKKDTKNENSELKNNSSYNSLINEYHGKEIPCINS